MAMTPYEKGRAFEYSTIRALKAKGFTCMRSYASRTPADIWAVRGGRAYFIQAKLHGDISAKEWDAFLDYCLKAGAEPIISKRPDGRARGVEFYRILDRRGTGKRPWELLALTDFGLI